MITRHDLDTKFFEYCEGGYTGVMSRVSNVVLNAYANMREYPNFNPDQRKDIIDGLPRSAIANCNFLLLPPDNVSEGLSACSSMDSRYIV